MDTESTDSSAAEDPRLERAIVLQLLRDDHEPRWSRSDLGREIDAEAPAMEAALRRLDGEGVLCRAQDDVWASRAARWLDELELIGV